MDTFNAVMAESLTDGGLLAHLSYALLILAMLMSRIVWLRLLAIASGVAGFAYLWVFLEDRVASVWEVLFIAANVYQLALTTYRDRMSRFDSDEMVFRAAVIPGLSPSDARRLLKIGRVVDVPLGTVILKENEPVPALTFILSGEVDVTIGGQRVGRCAHGDFLGEIGVMSGAPATASAVAATPVRTFAFEAAALRRLVSGDRTIGMEMDLAFRQGLREKLVRANAALAAQPAPG